MLPSKFSPLPKAAESALNVCQSIGISIIGGSDPDSERDVSLVVVSFGLHSNCVNVCWVLSGSRHLSFSKKKTKREIN